MRQLEARLTSAQIRSQVVGLRQGDAGEAKAAGVKPVAMDPGLPDYDEVADVRIRGPAGSAVPRILA